MFHKKDIDDKMLLKIQKMFHDNERINLLFIKIKLARKREARRYGKDVPDTNTI
jgi:hypothetical protein